MIDTVAAEDEQLKDSARAQKRPTALRRWKQWLASKPLIAVPYGWVRQLGPFPRLRSRAFLYSYAVVLLLVVTVQALCLFLLWRPPQVWISFIRDFSTSPAIAGLFALVAALVGARSLGNQLVHTKEKAADEAWWQQFEWVTDRLIPSATNKDSLLPLSLAFDLTSSLSEQASRNVARAPFQQAAVDGFIDHYLIGRAAESPAPQGQPSVSDRQGMDEAAASSLRNLINTLPSTSRSTGTAERVLQGYEYEREVMNALRHQGFGFLEPQRMGRLQPDAVFTSGSETVVLEVKLSIPTDSMLHRMNDRMREMKEQFGATRGLVVMPPKGMVKRADYAPEGFDIVEWDPATMRSSTLKSKIQEVLSANNA